jgi:hypothetical protein
VRFWKERGLCCSEKMDFLAAIPRKAHFYYNDKFCLSGTAVRLADSRQAASQVSQVSIVSLATQKLFNFLVITSLPYSGRRTYRPDQRLRKWFAGGAWGGGIF